MVKKINNKRVMVFMGGKSAEREVSLRSGQAVYDALMRMGYTVQKYDVQHEPLEKIVTFNPDLVFLALHGQYGEDGAVQGMLELLGIPYTCSGVAASAICINKALSKKMFQSFNIPTPKYACFSSRDLHGEIEQEIKQIVKDMGLPLVIKAATQGSSIGVFIVHKQEEILPNIKEALQFSDEVVVEEFIAGTEVTASVIGNDDLEVLPLIEITSKNTFYDYDSKYTPGMCEHIIPARINKDVQAVIEAISRKTYHLMGCKGFARIDFMINKKGEPFVLEVNTIPGCTDMSLVPDAARAAGISFDEFVEKIIALAEDNFSK